jgi:hypothetical protein
MLMLLLSMQAELLAQQLALSYAMFLFCVQHTFEGVYRVPRAEYDRAEAVLLGSSYLSMPWWWCWVTVGVEYHCFHHQNVQVPCYRLQVGPGGGLPPVVAREGGRKGRGWGGRGQRKGEGHQVTYDKLLAGPVA